MNVQPYLYFGGRCEEALDFYRRAIGAKVLMSMRFDEAPEPPRPGTLAPGFEKKVMHSAFQVGDSTLLASDGSGFEQNGFSGITLTLNAADDDEATRLFDALGEDGQVHVPLGKTFFASSFGVLADRFGVPWIVICALPT